MNIKVVSGTGTGKTLLSAFDAALKTVGVYNYNLICLSSIVPPHSQIEKINGYNTPDEEYGYKLYIIKSEKRSEVEGRALAAGLGWYQLEDNRGVFVEHSAEGNNEEEVKIKVERDIKNSLSDLCEFRGFPFDINKVNFSIASIVVKETPSCALTIAVYKPEGWD